MGDYIEKQPTCKVSHNSKEPKKRKERSNFLKCPRNAKGLAGAGLLLEKKNAAERRLAVSVAFVGAPVKLRRIPCVH